MVKTWKFCRNWIQPPDLHGNQKPTRFLNPAFPLTISRPSSLDHEARLGVRLLLLCAAPTAQGGPGRAQDWQHEERWSEILGVPRLGHWGSSHKIFGVRKIPLEKNGMIFLEVVSMTAKAPTTSQHNSESKQVILKMTKIRHWRSTDWSEKTGHRWFWTPEFRLAILIPNWLHCSYMFLGIERCSKKNGV